MGRDVGVSAIALAAAIAVVACDEAGTGRAGAGGANEADPCDFDVETLLSCADETCDLDAHAEALGACTVDDKADDGDGETERSWIERLQQKLADRAEKCFEAKDVGCVEKVYFALAAGAKVKGMHNAAGMMWNFLTCGDDPATITAKALEADASVITVMEGARAVVWQYGEELVAQGMGDGEYPVEVAKTGLSADSADLWYAMGSFHVEGTAKVVLEGGAVKSVTIDYKATDRYDWHPGASAGGDAEGVSTFKDDWAQFLVDEGAACEFDMVGEWSETLTEKPPEVEVPDPPDLPPLGEGDCCEDHGGRGCEVEACQTAVCDMDPYCCDTQWEVLCVDQATKLTACGCEAPEDPPPDPPGDDDDAMDTDGGGEEPPEPTSCVDACGEVLATCACDDQCTELMDCCDDYVAECTDG